MTLAPTPRAGPRPKYRPPIGIPTPNQNSVGSAFASVVVHAIIVFLLIGPIFIRQVVLTENQAAGGRGPAGGGGGGNRGGAVAERVSYVEMTPPPPAPRSQPAVLPQPVPVKPPEPKPEQPKQDPVTEPSPPPAAAATGTGNGGTGSDGTGGSGPGSGGGVGSGVGTGRGSATGPGTGGGPGRVYPPTVTHLAVLPLPVPSKVRPYTMVAVFEVDERGQARLLTFNETKDSGYNKKVRAMLEEIRFRPAVRADGTPVRDTTTVTAEARL
ncbi:MAG: hypothetical protein FJ202_08775 [Gemmatimonadetes bacterium]|nr:hypothetical protein [Gemmatimonadota bacterium]